MNLTAAGNYQQALLTVNYLAAAGHKLFCISPGSRSTPLTVAAARNENIKTEIFYDERAAAFFAVGYARACGYAAPLICTSGTAVANYFPAVVEAYQSRLPMILLTADRPEELQDCGANQTIDQIDIFGKYAQSITLEAPAGPVDPERIIEQLEGAIFDAGSPVHINCRFRKPLLPDDAAELIRIEKEMESVIIASPTRGQMPVNFDEAALARAADLTRGKARGLIIAGPEAPIRGQDGLAKLANKLNWPLLSDILSQQRKAGHKDYCRYYDWYLDNDRLVHELKPELVLHVGGLPTSKRLNQFIKKIRGVPYVKLQDHDRTSDPDRVETLRVHGNINEAVAYLLESCQAGSDDYFRKMWLECEKKAAAAMVAILDGDELSQAAAVAALGAMIDSGDGLYLANSLPVRLADSLLSPQAEDLICGCNRGASGIDGTLASACGFACGAQRRTTVVAGDLALYHDINSLYLAANSETPLTILALNNHGGGIFDYLPIAGYGEMFENYFITPHNLNFENAAKQFKLNYYCPQNVPEFREIYLNASSSEKSTLIEIITVHGDDYALHRRIRESIHSAI